MKEKIFANSNPKRGYLTSKVNAFTLIELLAIIVILAIIAVITVPIILNVIDNASKGAAINSAYGFRDSVSNGYLTGILSNDFEQPPTGTYIMISNGNMTDSNSNVLITNVSGNYPEEDSWIELNRGQVVAFSLKFGEYVVTKYSDTDPVAVKGGTIAENTVAREARLEAERQASAIELARTIVDAETGTTGITDITEGWVAFINGSLKAYSVSVTVGDYTYIVTDNDVNSSNSNAVASRTLTTVAEKTTAEQAIVSYKVDTYVKAALTANSSLTNETAKTVAEMSSVTTNPADSGWIHFNKVNNTAVVVDYSLTYGSLTANYSSLTDGNYVSTFGSSRNKPILVGSPVCYGPTESQECFKVISTNSSTTLLLADNNLKKDTTTNPVTYKQDSSSPNTMTFSSSTYWHDSTNSVLKSEYAKDINGGAASYSGNPYPYVYNLQGSDTNNVKPYVDGYLTTLKTETYGLPASATGRLLTYEEAADTTIFANDTARANGNGYWLGSAIGGSYVRYVDGNGYISSRNSYFNGYGVRPVIVISTSDLQ